MDNSNRTSTTNTNASQSDQDIERLVDAQSKGEQPQGVETEQQTGQAQTRSSEVDQRDSKGLNILVVLLIASTVDCLLPFFFHRFSPPFRKNSASIGWG